MVFPPRDQPFDFGLQLNAFYRDSLGRGAVSAFVDLEGWNVWIQEYLRYRVNECSHSEASTRVFAQIAGGGVLPVCGQPPSGQVAFPPRDQSVDFGLALNAFYRDNLGRGAVSTFVDLEGWIVWIQEYLRYRVNGCGHVEASSKVFTQISGGGVQPICFTGPRTTFGPGQYRVNTDIKAGRYYSDPVSACYWERQRGFGGTLSDIIANEFIAFDAGQWIVDIRSSDKGFETDPDCGTWFNTPRRGLRADISPGMWLVGAQISPGTYRASTRPGCYWERLRDFTGTLNGIIANEFVAGGGSRLVSIAGSDAGFDTDDDCGQWTRVSPFTTSSNELPTHRVQSTADIEQQRMMNRRQNGAVTSKLR